MNQEQLLYTFRPGDWLLIRFSPVIVNPVVRCSWSMSQLIGWILRE